VLSPELVAEEYVIGVMLIEASNRIVPSRFAQLRKLRSHVIFSPISTAASDNPARLDAYHTQPPSQSVTPAARPLLGA